MPESELNFMSAQTLVGGRRLLRSFLFWRLMAASLGASGLIAPVVYGEAASATSPASPPEAPSSARSESQAEEEWTLFPRDELFSPLVADVRWPRFSAAYQNRLGTDDFNSLAVVSFGETFAFARSPESGPDRFGQWEFGIQAAVHSIFDAAAPSFDLTNSDFFVGLTAALFRKGVTTQARIYHISSHLGDEFLIATNLPRVGVSVEVLDVLVSAEPWPWLRIYGGGGVYLNARPEFDPVLTQMGVEWTSPWRFAGGLLTPIAGVDVQIEQEHDWLPEVAVLLGLRLAEAEDDARRIEFFARYYHGRSPDGQFFEQTIDSIGAGLRLGF